MQFEFNNEELDSEKNLPDTLPDGVKEALTQFMHALSENSVGSDFRMKMGQVSAKASHKGERKNGDSGFFSLDLSDKTGVSELYGIQDFGTRTNDNIRKGYLVGKYGATPDVEIEEVN